MPVWDTMADFVKTAQKYLLGKGVLSLAVMGTTMVAASIGGATAIFLPSLVVAAGGAALSGFMRLNAQADYEQKMVDLYREDIALTLGKNPKDITRADLKDAARDNEVIDQAINRQRRKLWLGFATSAIAAAATFGLLNLGLAGSVGDTLVGVFDDAFGKAANILRYASVGIVSGTSSLVLHNGLDAAIGIGSGISKASAHDLITEMDHDVKHGRAITPEQVYAVIVAENSELQNRITQRFNKPYHRMNARERSSVITALGLMQDMSDVARRINAGEIPPGRLAYMMHSSQQPKSKPSTATNVVDAPIQTRSDFVERLGLAPRQDKLFSELYPQRDMVASSAAALGR